MTFTPKFVDLVRNVTTIQGTGPVTLGTAVSGYTGIGEALSPGEQFYYCIQGVDKPQEREVGRGTLRSDGKVDREPVTGALTNFSNGTKTIALVAAAEWFAKLESGGAGGKSSVANVRDFGAIGDGVANDGAAFVEALAALKAAAANDLTIYKGSARLFIPAGHYYLGTTTLDITHTLIIEGEGSGMAGGIATKLRWAANTTGIRIQRANTSGASTVDGANHYGGDATIIQNLLLHGAFTNLASEGAYHGVHAKARVLVRDCFIQNWQGNGINIVATAGGGTLEGNANQFAIERTTAWYCQNGIFIDGADANAGYTLGCDVSYNRQWGLWDSSFLGNQHGNHHAANNGLADNGVVTGGLPPTLVSHNGNIYYVKVGQEAAASTNAPSGTAASNSAWGYLQPGGVLGLSVPAWVSGAAYRSGGCYRTDDANASIILSGCYAEGGQGPVQTSGGTLIIGGIWGPGLGDHGAFLYSANSAVGVRRDLAVGRSINALGTAQGFGPLSGTPGDTSLTVRSVGSGVLSWINFDNYDAAGTPVETSGYVFAEQGVGLVFNGKSNGAAIRLRANGASIATVKSAGVDLASGKALSVGGTQVVGPQQAAIANHASDSTVNAILGALRAHGLIAS